MITVLAIDPGSEKCGIAVVSDSGVHTKAVVPRNEITHTVPPLLDAHRVDRIIIGNGTGGFELASELEALALAVPVELVNETRSSERARSRFFVENPPRGLRRLIPRGLLTPSHPYDDYVALILGEEYLQRERRR